MKIAHGVADIQDGVQGKLRMAWRTFRLLAMARLLPAVRRGKASHASWQSFNRATVEKLMATPEACNPKRQQAGRTH